jgi:Potential Queuosine, Q, salvage protein family
VTVDAGLLLPAGGEWEREIRACAVHACELLARRIGVPPPSSAPQLRARRLTIVTERIKDDWWDEVCPIGCLHLKT